MQGQAAGSGSNLTEIAALEMTTVRLGLQGPACCFREDLISLKKAALGVNVGPQPRSQRLKVTAAEGRPHLRLSPTGSIEELGRCDGTQGVGWKVPPSASRPVDVLQAAKSVIGKLSAQGVPGLRR